MLPHYRNSFCSLGGKYPFKTGFSLSEAAFCVPGFVLRQDGNSELSVIFLVYSISSDISCQEADFMYSDPKVGFSLAGVAAGQPGIGRADVAAATTVVAAVVAATAVAAAASVAAAAVVDAGDLAAGVTAGIAAGICHKVGEHDTIAGIAGIARITGHKSSSI